MLGRVDHGAAAVDATATVRGYAQLWLAGRAGRRRSESTVREYRRRLEAYVLPHIGGIRVPALTILDVEDVLDDLAATGLSASTVAGARIALAAMLTDAVRARQLSVNVAAMARLPEMGRAERVSAPTPRQVLDLLDAAAWFAELTELLTVLATTGVRVGKALGAFWSDIDLQAGIWAVRRTTTVNSTAALFPGSPPRPATPGASACTTPRSTRCAPSGRGCLPPAWSPGRGGSSTTWCSPPRAAPCGTRATPASGSARSPPPPCSRGRSMPCGTRSRRPRWRCSRATRRSPKSSATGRKSTTVDLYGHVRDEDFTAVTDAVVAGLGGVAPPPIGGVKRDMIMLVIEHQCRSAPV
jgi:hypothetical protein